MSFGPAQFDPASGQLADGSPASRPAGLIARARRTEALLADLSTTRDDVLAPVDLNRMLRQLLGNQAAILRALATGAPAPAPAGAPPELGSAPVERELREPAAPVVAAPVVDAPAEASPPLLVDAPAEASPPLGEGATSSVAAAFLGVHEEVSGTKARTFVAAFDHRDQSFERGLEKLNRWTEGSGGTPFQVRQDRAYLNVGSSAESAQRYEKNLMERMGFSRRLGRLTITGLDGEIVVYERP